MRARVLAVLIGIGSTVAANAADIYFWTDENGKTYLGDTVPAQHRKSALRIDSTQFELSPEQQREAAAARAALMDKAREASAPASADPARARKPAASPSPSRAYRPGPTLAGEKTECDVLQREYLESLECFAPYMNANGTVKPGAFSACRTVVNPTLKCGSAKAY